MNYILIFAGVVIGIILVLYLIGKFDPEIKAQNLKDKSSINNITTEYKNIKTENDLEGYLLKRDSGFSPEYKFLMTLLNQLKTGKISNEEDLENYIKDYFKKLDESELLLKQSLYKI